MRCRRSCRYFENVSREMYIWSSMRQGRKRRTTGGGLRLVGERFYHNIYRRCLMYSLVMHVQLRMNGMKTSMMDWILRVSKENAAFKVAMTSFKQRISRRAVMKEYFKVLWECRYCIA